MLSIPAEVLPRFCATPRSVAALALTCAELAARLRLYAPIFRVVKKHTVAAEVRSEYYTCGFYTADGAVVNGATGCNHPTMQSCRVCCDTVWYSDIMRAESVWILFGTSGIMAICHDPEHIFNIRCSDYQVYKLWQITTTPQLVCIRSQRDTATIILSEQYLRSTQAHGLINAMIDPGTFVYKRMYDTFYPYSASPAHLAASEISLCLVSRA